MRIFSFKMWLIGDSLSAHSFFKNFIIWVVVMLMTTSSTIARQLVIDDLNYLLDSETKTAVLLNKGDGNYSGDIIVPEKVKAFGGVEYLVVAFDQYCFYKASELTSVTIPSSVKSLGNFCFSECSSLKSITIPSSVTSLGESCFEGCI